MITCTFEDGGKGNLRHVTANAIITNNGKILLAKRGTYNGGKQLSEGGKWALIGGFLNRDEDIKSALMREVKEETGFEINNLKLLHIKDNPDRPKEDRQNIEFVYIAETSETQNIKNEEVSQIAWFDMNKLPDESEIAFDHADDLTLYKMYVDKKVQIPIIGKMQSV